MKEKIIGLWLLILGCIAFVDQVHPIDIGIYHIRPFIMPFALVTIGWLEVHGRVPLKNRHLAHFIVFVAIWLIVVTYFCAVMK